MSLYNINSTFLSIFDNINIDANSTMITNFHISNTYTILNLNSYEPLSRIPPVKIFNIGKTCIICDENKNTVFAPCGHYITCASCSTKCNTCPMGRQQIKSRFERQQLPE